MYIRCLMPERAAPPTLTAQIAPFLTPCEDKMQKRQSFVLPISYRCNQFLIRLQPPLFLFGHSSKSANAREADQWATDVWSCIDGSSSSPPSPPLPSSSILWCVAWIFSIMSSCESYEKKTGEGGRCEKQPDAAVSHLIWSDFRYLVSSCLSET